MPPQTVENDKFPPSPVMVLIFHAERMSERLHKLRRLAENLASPIHRATPKPAHRETTWLIQPLRQTPRSRDVEDRRSNKIEAGKNSTDFFRHLLEVPSRKDKAQTSSYLTDTLPFLRRSG